MRFTALENPPFGVPIYLESAAFNQVSLRLLIFTGGADDATGGGPGIYHWFEHVPFRGTKIFPQGYEDTIGRLERYGGRTNAQTALEYTAFHTVLPKEWWLEGLRLIIDLVSQPLLTNEGIEAERKVIHSEIASRLSNSTNSAWYKLLQEELWPGHAYGHHPLGTIAGLNQITPATLRAAQAAGYDRARMALVISGDLTASEVRQAAEKTFNLLPDNKLSARRSPASYGPLPAWQPGQKEFATTFDSSLVITGWPIPALTPEIALVRPHLWSKLADLFNAGSLASPLMQITRGDNPLVYGARAGSLLYRDGGMFFLAASTHQDPQLVLEAFQAATLDERVRSNARYDYVNDHLRGEMEMTVLDPHTHTQLLAATIMMNGQAICSHEELLAGDLAITHQELLDTLATLTPETARTFIFKAKK